MLWPEALPGNVVTGERYMNTLTTIETCIKDVDCTIRVFVNNNLTHRYIMFNM